MTKSNIAIPGQLKFRSGHRKALLAMVVELRKANEKRMEELTFIKQFKEFIKQFKEFIMTKSNIAIPGQKKSDIEFLSAHRDVLLAMVADLRKDNEKRLEELDADAENGIMDMDNLLEKERGIADTFDLIVVNIKNLR